MTVCEGRVDLAGTHCVRMAREILATRLDFGEPSGDAKIGDGACATSVRMREIFVLVTGMSTRPRYGCSDCRGCPEQYAERILNRS
jgi:hypothetical protein